MLTLKIQVVIIHTLNKAYDTKKLDRVLISFKYYYKAAAKHQNHEKSKRSFK